MHSVDVAPEMNLRNTLHIGDNLYATYLKPGAESPEVQNTGISGP